MNVKADRDRCIASGSCVVECPQVFALDDEGLVVVLDANPDESLREAVQSAADICPAACIDVED
jgi:ferredoxin